MAPKGKTVEGNVLKSIIQGATAHEEATQPEPQETEPASLPLHEQDPVPASEEVPPEVPMAPEPESPTRTLRRIANQPLPTPAPPPASASTLQKMKDQGMYRNQYFKDVQCFDCGHAFKVGRSSRSANCPQCGALISLEDVEINNNYTQVIKTRGDVIIRKPGHLATSLVQCKDLRCFGVFEANIECAGDAIFKAVGTMTGEVRCHRLVIEKGANVTFSNLIYAEEVEIHSKVVGTIFSKGAVLITAYGSIDGDVTARSVSIEPGGELNGAMNIIRADSILPTTPSKE